MRFAFVVLSLAICSAAYGADRIVLRDGFTVLGDVSLEANRIVIKTGSKMTVVGTQQLLAPEPAAQEPPPPRFTLRQPVATERAQPLQYPPDQTRSDAFDEFSRRTIYLRHPKKGEFPVHQAITEVYPTHVVLEATGYNWKTTLSLEHLPTLVLLQALHRSIDNKSQPDRIRVIDFLLTAGRLEEANIELEIFRRDFPDAKTPIAEMGDRLRSAVFERVLLRFHRAIAAGQLSLAEKIVTTMDKAAIPTDREVKFAEAAKELNLLLANLKKLRERLVADFNAVPDGADKNLIVAAGQEIQNGLSLANHARLTPVAQLADQPGVSESDRIALAMSGWALGPALAQRDLSAAVAIWKQRSYLIQAMSAPDGPQLTALCRDFERAGSGPDVALEMFPLLPAPSADIPIATAAEQKAPDQESIPGMKYQVYLPSEYDRFREYPTIVTLHSVQSSPAESLRFWQGLAEERGYIIVAPEYIPDRQKPYEYTASEHVAFLNMLADARKRYAIDADRVYLCGHDLGGFVAWDIGSAHPDQFAALATFSGVPVTYATRYLPNLALLPVFAVEGQMNGANPSQIQYEFTRYFNKAYDAIYVEYPGRGRDLFVAEIPTVADWMSRKRRRVDPSEFEATSCRESDTRFYWVDIDVFMPQATVRPQLFDRTRFRPAKIDAKATDANSIYVTTSGISQATILLSPRLVHLSDDKLNINVNRKLVHKGVVKPELDTMVREVRRTGDRKHLIVKKIIADRL